MKEKKIDHVTDKPMTLADIFNYQEKDYTSKNMIHEIGFNANQKVK